MSIKSLYRDYFQKSRIFMYPALEIKRASSITPIETYISWDKIKSQDRKLICLYHLREDDEFKMFEKSKLLDNRLFDDFYELEDNKAVYIFDYGQYTKDWDCFLKGKYSKFSVESKKKIKEFFKNAREGSVYIDSYLYPEKYYGIYSDLLGVSESTLKDVGELTSSPDFEKEDLKLKLKTNEILTNLKTNI